MVRLGGDEFAVLTAVPLTFNESRVFAARLVDEVAGPIVVEVDDGLGGFTERCVTVSVSVGFAHSENAGQGRLAEALDLILRQADVALCQAKEQGRDRAQCFVAGMN